MGLRVPIFLTVGVVLVAGLWAALVRIGWAVPSVGGINAVEHGALMLSGFMGTLISLERAVALRRGWTFLPPVLSAAGAVWIVVGLPPIVGQCLTVLAGAWLVAVFAYIYRLHPSLDTGVMGVGAVLWLVGNGVWLLQPPVFHAVPWWAGFLILTVAGERLELSRVLRPGRAARLLFAAVVLVMVAGMLLSLVAFEWGVSLSGAGLIGLAGWLLVNDVARCTVRKTGLTRYIAACLLPGFVWMAVGGALWIVAAPLFVGGMLYDAMLHTLFLGFVFSMIFGHAPIILPAVTQLPVRYHPRFYLHLVLLHASLLLRVAGDLALSQPLRQWGGLLNVVAVLVFLGSTFIATRQARTQPRPQPQPQPVPPVG